jgi:gliding motility-associated lipoprotein GldH
MKIGVTSILFLIVLVSCSSPYIEKKEASVDSLSRRDTLHFSFELEKGIAYGADLIIEHATGYTYENLYLLILSEGPDMTIHRDTFSVQLAENDGYWIGDCDGTNCSLATPLFRRLLYERSGQWNVSIIQFSRDEQIHLVERLGIGLKQL